MSRLLIALLGLYKRTVSRWLPPACRFSPTCSEYAALALGKYGFWRGSALAAWRLLRCQPFAAGGIDIP
jgi:putative membrane protein insertion efficiency factor